MFVQDVVGDVKFDAQKMKLSGFIGSCRINILQYISGMELLDKKLAGPGPEISVHPGVTMVVFFCVCGTYFLTEDSEATCFTGDWST